MTWLMHGLGAGMTDRVFWVILSCLWLGWRQSLVIVKPETVIGWHRKGFGHFWTWKSRRGKPGRPPVSRENLGVPVPIAAPAENDIHGLCGRQDVAGEQGLAFPVIPRDGIRHQLVKAPGLDRQFHLSINVIAGHNDRLEALRIIHTTKI